MTSELLFDPSVLAALDSAAIERDVSLPLGCTALSPGPGLRVRPLSISDFSAGYIELLSQLTSTGNVSGDDFRRTFEKMSSLKDTYYIVVIEDTNTGQVIGTGTLLVEQKFIHSCALRGRVEDIVVSDRYRGKQLGKLIVLLLTQLAKKLKIYKISLDCKDSNRPFYESLGYSREEGNSNFMIGELCLQLSLIIDRFQALMMAIYLPKARR